MGWLGYTSLGLISTAVGSALPALIHELHRGYASVAALFLAAAVGNTLAYFTANILVDRRGGRRVLKTGLLLMALGLGPVFWTESFALWLLAFGIQGIGFGLIDVSSARIVNSMYHPRQASPLNRLNAFFGLGAVVSPFLVGALIEHGLKPSLAFTGIALWSLAGVTLLSLAKPEETPIRQEAQEVLPRPSYWQFVRHSPWLWLLAIICFVYVAAEAGFTAWDVAYVHARAKIPLQSAALVLSAFWLGLTASRFLAESILERLSVETSLIVGGLVGGVGILTGALLGGVPWVGFVAAVVAGVGLGPVFPATLAIAGSRAPGRESITFFQIYAAMSLGFLVAPWAEGQIFSRNMEAALFLIALTGLLMAVAAIPLVRKEKESSV